MSRFKPSKIKRYISNKDRIKQTSTVTAYNRLMDERMNEIVTEDQRKARESYLKGIKGGNCNRTACQKPHAIFFHHSTRAYYCAACTHMLNFDELNHADAQNIYGHLMIQLDMDAYQTLLARSLLPGNGGRAIERALDMAEHLIEHGEIVR